VLVGFAPGGSVDLTARILSGPMGEALRTAVIVENRPGFAVVANSRQYAMRLDPARRADMNDGLLDVVFVPFRSRVRLAAWSLGMRLGLHMADSDTVYERGSRVTIDSAPGRRPGPSGFGLAPGSALYQLDGEAPGVSYDRAAGPALTPIECSVDPGALRVLCP
jgi:diacylglycerol kinase family enzyme